MENDDFYTLDDIELIERKIYVLKETINIEGLFDDEEREMMIDQLKYLIEQFVSLQIGYGDERDDDGGDEDDDEDGPTDTFKFRLYLN
jgi:hypothetical protein